MVGRRQGWLLVFPAYNALRASLLLILFGQRLVGTDCITDEPAQRNPRRTPQGTAIARYGLNPAWMPGPTAALRSAEGFHVAAGLAQAHS